MKRNILLFALAVGWVMTVLMGINRILHGESPSLDALLIEAALYFCTFVLVFTIAKNE